MDATMTYLNRFKLPLTILMIGAIFTFVAFSPRSAYAGDITLTIEGIRNTNGRVYILVFGDESSFENLKWNNVVDGAELKATTGKLRHTFTGAQAGETYAIVVFHDENGDENLNMRGDTPMECFGVSGMTNINQLPSFQQAAISSGSVTVKVFCP